MKRPQSVGAASIVALAVLAGCLGLWRRPEPPPVYISYDGGTVKGPAPWVSDHELILFSNSIEDFTTTRKYRGWHNVPGPYILDTKTGRRIGLGRLVDRLPLNVGYLDWGPFPSPDGRWVVWRREADSSDGLPHWILVRPDGSYARDIGPDDGTESINWVPDSSGWFAVNTNGIERYSVAAGRSEAIHPNLCGDPPIPFPISATDTYVSDCTSGSTPDGLHFDRFRMGTSNAPVATFQWSGPVQQEPISVALCPGADRVAALSRGPMPQSWSSRMLAQIRDWLREPEQIRPDVDLVTIVTLASGSSRAFELDHRLTPNYTRLSWSQDGRKLYAGDDKGVVVYENN